MLPRRRSLRTTTRQSTAWKICASPPLQASNRFAGPSYPHDFADPDAGWTEKRQSGVPDTYAAAPPTRNRKKMYWTIGGAVLAVVLIIGVVAGIVVAKHKSSDDAASSSSSSSSGSNSNVLSGDPSKFKKNSALHNSFWGMCYTPFKSQYQYGCGVDLASVVEDVQTLSQLTSRVRLYGADCNVTALMLDAFNVPRSTSPSTLPSISTRRTLATPPGPVK